LASSSEPRSAAPAEAGKASGSRILFSGDGLGADETVALAARVAECDAKAANAGAGEALEETVGFTYGVVLGGILGFALAVAWFASCYDERTGTSAD